MINKHLPRFALAWAFLLSATLACSINIGSGARSGDASEATLTPAAFATTTPGGVISVSLLTPDSAEGQALPTIEENTAGDAAIVAPVGTATAQAAIIGTATTQAEAPAGPATYQPGACPAPRNPAPPGRPTTFAAFPSAIAQYLSAGGPTTLLEGALRSWGAVTEAGGLVKVDTDVTGDGGAEVIITIYDPNRADLQPQPGQLLIFGCEAGGYRLLYASTQDPHISLPVLLRVGDMNGDARAEVVYQIQRCTTPEACVGEVQILSWDATLGNFRPLNAGAASAPNAHFTVGDVDEDGVLELSATGHPVGDGPARISSWVWDWNGQSYLLALTERAPAEYRIHAVHDGDAALAAGNYPDARSAYNQVLTDESLLPWHLPNERAYLNAYALYRLMLTYALQQDSAQAQATFDRLNAEYGEARPGAAYADLARAFWDEYSRTNNLSTACAIARSVATTRSDILMVLNGYGTANRTYTVEDMCPY